MNRSLIKIFKEIKYEPINKKYFKHNLQNDFHLIALPIEKKNKYIDELKKWIVLNSITIDWNNQLYYKRVFEKIFTQSIIIYIVKDPKPKYQAIDYNYSEIFLNEKSKELEEKIKNDFENIYITKNPMEFIEKFLLIFGFNSLNYLIINEKTLDKLKPLNTPLGTFGWRSFNEFIFFANISCDWVVIRNFEFLPLNFFSNDKDIDILCRNRENFINKLNLKKRSWGISAYQTKIEEKTVPVDLRFMGDGYFDKLWQSNILKNKVFQNQVIPRPCNLDYFYSLIYNCKLQKNKVKNIYSQRLYQLKNKLGMQSLNKSFILNDIITAQLLSEFLNKNNYSISKPSDINVKINKRFYKIINSFFDIGITPKLPLFTRLRIFLPFPIRRLIVNSRENIKFKIKHYKFLFKKYK